MSRDRTIDLYPQSATSRSNLARLLVRLNFLAVFFTFALVAIFFFRDIDIPIDTLGCFGQVQATRTTYEVWEISILDERVAPTNSLP